MNEKELIRQKRIHGLSEKLSVNETKLLKKGVPIQKIIGFINFDNLKINVNRRVLIPRYETEEVIREALKYISKKSSVLDLCCGSGYIGLTIKQKTGASVVLSDISKQAMLQSKENAILNNLNVVFIKSNLFKKINQKFDVIISNPPYVPKKSTLSKSVINHEPRNALFAGVDGNKFYKKIINNAQKYLKPNGYLIFEISEDNKEYLEKHNFLIKKDINGKARIAIKSY